MTSSETRESRRIFSEKMVADLEEALDETTAGVTQVTIDGNTVSYNRNQLLTELEFWRKQADRLNRSKGRFTTMKLDNSHEY